MRTSLKASLAAAVAVGALVALGPAIGQDRPESILPPGFGEPTPAPAPRPTPPAGTQPPRPTGPTQPSAPQPAPSPAQPGAMIQPLPATTPGDAPLVPPVATPAPVDPAVLAQYEMPASARRSLATVGPVTASEGGLDTDAFGDADGQYVETLMRRLSAPLPSRWMSILLRRALVSHVDTPSRTNGADFAAERAWLLLRMGESVAARAVAQNVDTDNYTPKLYQVAMNTALATGDPAGLCPLVTGAMRYAPARGWTMAQAMCAGLSGNPAQASPLIATAKRRNVASGVDLLLAQKVVGAGAQGRQAVTIEWDGVDRLTAWRFGLAMATGVTVPDELYGTAGPQVKYWQALSPSVALGDRLAPAEAAAGQGVLSSAALVDLYAAAATDDDTQSGATATANDLQTAYADRNPDSRLTALRQLWGGANARPSYARLVLTARAAARMNPALAKAEADHLVASMLSAGLDRTAARWLGSVPAGSDAWAMIMLSDPDAYRRLSYSDLASYTGGEGDSALKQRMLFAGLAGLGRLNQGDIERAAQSLGVRIGADNAWTRALDSAARDGQAGTVVLLAAVGMQAGSWKDIPPEALYRIVGALRGVGLDGEARMIAAEAIARA
ncbi:hypothetical protein C8J45_103292 [Sphingomonas sp. PP-CE-3G-477]|uniref:hypothetical protein n=1 Tax=Sphingomonas sp. PP-CE-3G-477 TaxID=2135660 RepID=UPI000D34EC96|nr:hypothetical protein [Sphingomonas sp. PP-CE-3G-477]PTQ64443.1 hypothetical protein C8J45_103292 [Sphingomonas sp. PP-CE-3G-477]